MHPNGTTSLLYAESKYPDDHTGLIEGRFISLYDNDGDDNDDGNVETTMMMMGMMMMVLR